MWFPSVCSSCGRCFRLGQAFFLAFSTNVQEVFWPRRRLTFCTMPQHFCSGSVPAWNCFVRSKRPRWETTRREGKDDHATQHRLQGGSPLVVVRTRGGGAGGVSFRRLGFSESRKLLVGEKIVSPSIWDVAVSQQNGPYLPRMRLASRDAARDYFLCT